MARGAWLRYLLRPFFLVARAAEAFDRVLLSGERGHSPGYPAPSARALSRVQSGSLTEYLLLLFTGLALLVVARLFA